MRRILFALCVVSLMFAAAPTAAFAWRNGPTRDGFGTHDWILYHAMKVAGEDASWVDVPEALLSTDDPDVWRDSYASTSPEYRLEQPRHLFYPDVPTKQGAPQAVTNHYALMVKALAAKDTVTASRELGYLSHYYSDALVPFHAQRYGPGALEEGADHRNFETAVDAVLRSPDDNAGWVTPLAPRPVSDVRARTIEAASFSGGMMLGLIGKYGTFENYDPNTDPQVKLLLNRAVNDLADVIRSAKTGSGQPRPIASIQLWADYDYPALGRPARVWARVKDDKGRVVHGVQVNFNFRVTQPATYTCYTDAKGEARETHDKVLGTLRVPFDVVVTAESAGATLTKTVTLLPTDVIGSGTSGLKTTIMNDSTPAQGTVVSVMTRVRNQKGQPIPGVKVVFTFRHKTKSVKKTVYSDAKGEARTSRNIGNSAAGYRTYVRADAYGGTEPQNTFDGIRTASASFVPHSKVASLKAKLMTSKKPKQSSVVKVRARCLDDHGKPIVGRKVKFTWKHKKGTAKTYAKTDASGYATTSRNIGKAPVGSKVTVTASIASGSKTKKSAVSFTPVKR